MYQILFLDWVSHTAGKYEDVKKMRRIFLIDWSFSKDKPDSWLVTNNKIKLIILKNTEYLQLLQYQKI